MSIRAEDLQFLVEMRDYLNSAASPATGSTIAFSTLVSDQATGYRAVDARQAYPGYARLARRLRIFIKAISGSAIIATFIIALLAAYVYWGNAIVVGASHIESQFEALNIDVAREEAAGLSEIPAQAARLATASPANIASDGAPMLAREEKFKMLVPLCSAIMKTSLNNQSIDVYRSAQHEQLCSKKAQLEVQQNAIQDELKNWGRPLSLIFGNGAQASQTVPYDLSTINGYVIPLLMGFLGSAAFVLRGFLRSLGERVLTTRDIQSHQVRLVLGTLSGLAIGFFLSPPSSGTPLANPLGMGINLTTPALAFLAGYAVEVLFKFLDMISTQAFSTKP